MAKIASSAAIRESIPTRPREGSTHRCSMEAGTEEAVLKTLSSSLILPIRIFWVLDVPERAPALDDGNPGKVVLHWRRTCGPLERPRVPRIVSSSLAFEIRPKQVSYEHNCPGHLEENADCTDQVPDVPSEAGLVSVNSSRHSQQTRDMHEIEGQMEPDKEKPEVPFAERFVVHLSAHFGEPIIESAKDGKKYGSHDDVVKMRDRK